MVEEQFELLKFCHPDRVTRASDKWVLGAYNLQRLAYIPQVITSQHVYDTKAEVTTPLTESSKNVVNKNEDGSLNFKLTLGYWNFTMKMV